MGVSAVTYGIFLMYLAPARWWGGALLVAVGAWLLWKYGRSKAAA